MSENTDSPAGPTEVRPEPAQDCVIKRWIIMYEPGMVPQVKGPMPDHDSNIAFLRELMRHNPTATFTVCEVVWNHDLWVTDGHEAIAIDDDMKLLPDLDELLHDEADDDGEGEE
ncbi:hypothetical protein [Azospirillum endophyticum]